MRKTVVESIALVLTLFLLILPASPSDADPSSAPLITEVDPACEGFTLYNPTGSGINLKGYSVTDGEGTLTFVSSRTLVPSGSITVAKSTGTCWFD